jgi:hypothetical protein
LKKIEIEQETLEKLALAYVWYETERSGASAPRDCLESWIEKVLVDAGLYKDVSQQIRKIRG